MRQLWLGVAMAGALWGQDAAPAGIVRGTVVERAEGAAGQIAIRDGDNRVLRLTYDGHTWMERDGRRIEAREIGAGDDVEIISDRGATPSEAYARRIRVMPAAAPLVRRPRSPGSPYAARSYRDHFEDIFPRGNLTFSGTVVEVAPESLLVRTRKDGPRRFRLREDTRYLANGGRGVADDLRVNTRVFVRAGKNFDGEVEAYSVVWGEILNPKE
jgi:hypothetical protein